VAVFPLDDIVVALDTGGIFSCRQQIFGASWSIQKYSATRIIITQTGTSSTSQQDNLVVKTPINMLAVNETEASCLG